MGSEVEKIVDIHHRRKRQYGETCRFLAGFWHRKFNSGALNLAAYSGRPHASNMPEITAKVKRMIRENRQVTNDEATEKNILNIYFVRSVVVQRTISLT